MLGEIQAIQSKEDYHKHPTTNYRGNRVEKTNKIQQDFSWCLGPGERHQMTTSQWRRERKYYRQNDSNMYQIFLPNVSKNKFWEGTFWAEHIYTETP